MSRKQIDKGKNKMNTLKTIAMAAIGAMSLFISGCEKELPSPEKISAVATTVGRTAGFACDLAKMDKEVKDNIVEVLDVVSTAIPTSNETFVVVWMPIASAEIQKLVDAGKLNDVGAAAAKIAINAAAEGVDFVFIKYPKAKDVKELVSAAVTGFVNGFKSVNAISSSKSNVEIDEEAYKYITEKISAKK